MIAESPKATGTRRERSMIGAARIVGCVLSFAGLVSVLRIGTTGETKDVATMIVHPATAVLWLVIGLVGIAMSVAAVRARLFLIVAGAILTAWGLAGLLSMGASDFLTNDPSTLTVLLVLGVGSLAVSLGPTPDFVEKALALPDAEAEDPDADAPPGVAEAISDGISAARRGPHREP
ncbi:MAG TPA: hypothetical protein VL422_11170 [Miltoncostaea sp.]|nr:hypothetical protein [Miltoncostaea sp.]